jgi:hypothetical protein
MSNARYFHTATLLSDGRVLLTSGVKFTPPQLGPLPLTPALTETTDLFDPAEKTFNAGPKLAVARIMHTATLLADGRVVVIGGEGLGIVEIYDPKQNLFIRSGELVQPRMKHQATLLAVGTILVSGGLQPKVNLFGKRRGIHIEGLASLERYDPKTGKSALLPKPMKFTRVGHRALAMPDGKVLLIGGGPHKEIEQFDPANDSIKVVGKLIQPRDDLAVFALDADRVLIVGGNGDERVSLTTAEIFDRRTGKAKLLETKLRRPASDQSVVRLNDGRFIFVGGEINESPGIPEDITLNEISIFDPQEESFTAFALTHQVRDDSTATLLKDGTVLVTGGEDDNMNGLDSAEILKSDSAEKPAGK